MAQGQTVSTVWSTWLAGWFAKAVETAGFNACTIECKDGRELSGILIGDSPASVTLRQPQGIEETIPRSGLTRLTVGQLSLMPEGLEAAMSPQELADLLSFLKGE